MFSYIMLMYIAVLSVHTFFHCLCTVSSDFLVHTAIKSIYGQNLCLCIQDPSTHFVSVRYKNTAISNGNGYFDFVIFVCYYMKQKFVNIFKHFYWTKVTFKFYYHMNNFSSSKLIVKMMLWSMINLIEKCMVCLYI